MFTEYFVISNHAVILSNYALIINIISTIMCKINSYEISFSKTKESAILSQELIIVIIILHSPSR